MVANPEWRVQNSTGGDLHPLGSEWGYNMSVPEMRAAWVDECVQAVREGCTGCFIDQSNVKEDAQRWGPGGPTSTSPSGMVGSISFFLCCCVYVYLCVRLRLLLSLSLVSCLLSLVGLI